MNRNPASFHLATAYPDVRPGDPPSPVIFEIRRFVRGRMPIRLAEIRNNSCSWASSHPTLSAAVETIREHQACRLGASWIPTRLTRAQIAGRMFALPASTVAIRLDVNAAQPRPVGGLLAVRSVYAVLTAAAGMRRATYIDADGPIGHVERQNMTDLFLAVAEDWSPIDIAAATAADVDALTTTDRWAAGAAALALVQAANAGVRS